jgi:hypothetical protein
VPPRLRLRLRRRPSLILIFTASEKHLSRPSLYSRSGLVARASASREKNHRPEPNCFDPSRDALLTQLTATDSNRCRRAFRFRNRLGNRVGAILENCFWRDGRTRGSDGYFGSATRSAQKKRIFCVTEIPYASTRNTRKKYRTTPAVPKGHRLLRSPTVCRAFSQSVTRRSASAPLKKTLFLLKRPNRLFRVGHVERTPVSTRPLLGARTRSQAKMSTTDEDPDKVVKNSWTPEVRSIHAPSRSPRARCFRRA